MKEQAPWTDRTGDARRGLRAWVEEVGPIGEIHVSHDEELDYAVWLEVAYQGRWGIISKTIDYWEPKFARGIQGMANLHIIEVVKD